jgi:hypothetical protein
MVLPLAAAVHPLTGLGVVPACDHAPIEPSAWRAATWTASMSTNVLPPSGS